MLLAIRLRNNIEITFYLSGVKLVTDKDFPNFPLSDGEPVSAHRTSGSEESRGGKGPS